MSIAYSLIKEEIMSERYKFGEVLSATLLAKKFGMSRTPVLEALKLLENEGIVTVVPQVGIIVRPLDQDRVFGILTIKALLEGYVAGEAAKRGSVELVDKLMKLIEDMECCVLNKDVDYYAELNVKFHQLIRETINNRYIKETISQVWDLSHYVGARRFIFSENLAQSLQEHRGCVEAIAARDAEKARSIMVAHFCRVRDHMIRLMK